MARAAGLARFANGAMITGSPTDGIWRRLAIVIHNFSCMRCRKCPARGDEA